MSPLHMAFLQETARLATGSSVCRTVDESSAARDFSGMKQLTFPIIPIPPFRLDLTAWALRRRPQNLVDR